MIRPYLDRLNANGDTYWLTVQTLDDGAIVQGPSLGADDMGVMIAPSERDREATESCPTFIPWHNVRMVGVMFV